jgi:hypothetical protein
MQPVTRISLLIYGCSVWLYPSELRKRFGPEMLDVFAELVAETSAQRGARGVASLWWITLTESLTVGLLSRLQSTAVIAGAVSFSTASLIVWSFFRAVG